MKSAKLKYKCRKTNGVTDYTNKTTQAFLAGKMSKFNTPQNEKIFMNVHKIGGTHLEYKGMKTFVVTDYINLAPKNVEDGRNGRTEWTHNYNV